MHGGQIPKWWMNIIPDLDYSSRNWQHLLLDFKIAMDRCLLCVLCSTIFKRGGVHTGSLSLSHHCMLVSLQPEGVQIGARVKPAHSKGLLVADLDLDARTL